MPEYRLSAAAEEDSVRLLAFTQDRFGETARRRYEALLVAGLRDVAGDPERSGSVDRPELGPGVRSYHLRHSRVRARTAHGSVHQPRHLLLYRVIRRNLIAIARVLHDQMEITRHLPGEHGDE